MNASLRNMEFCSFVTKRPIQILLPVLWCLIIASCSSEKMEPNDAYVCQTRPIQNNYHRNQLLESFDESIVEGIASIDVPDSSGAMGRNKNGYFHVRFQMGISAQTDLAVYNDDIQALEYAIKSIEYAFQYQLPQGDFLLVVPTELEGQVPGKADLASGVAFFLSSLGLALNDFDQSLWYHSAALIAYKYRIEALRPNIENAAMWLLTQRSTLENADANAPNRLFFDALAFYSLGKWLGNDELKSAGLSFAGLAMAKKHPNGYFLEGDGWDSSYQGVGVNVGFNLYTLLVDSEPLKPILWDCLSCAVNWQQSRVLSNGEISTAGNTRVFPGGEDFLGVEKEVDWIDTMTGFFMMGYLSNDDSYITAAHEVMNYYY